MAYRYRRTRMTPRERQATAAVAAGVVLAALVSGHASAHGATRASGHPDRAARAAIAYARAQIGCVYVYGATGPCSAGYDCSGLVMRAYHLPWSLRTSEEQWAGLPHVAASQRKAGDIVFAPGSPIDPPPGHVGVMDGRNSVIEAPQTGELVKQVSLSNFAANAGGITGFAEVG